ncbi:MAG: helix-turn-helix transcriptional regulator [Bacteroides sp.]|nr:helix-turn-helix transcriptional regulator [Bacteroides sp.]
MIRKNTSFMPEDRLRTLIEDNNLLLMVLARFGISFGFGDKTVRQVCAEDSVDCQSFLAVCNIIDGRDYSMFRISLSSLMGYLRSAHSYFLDFLLPSIRHKLLQSINSMQIDDIAVLLLRFFDSYVLEVRRHMEYENRRIFTYVDHLLEGNISDEFRIADYSLGHTSMADKLNELKDVFIRHYHQKDNMILASALSDIIACNQDLCSHCEIEDKLFIPAVEELEKSLQLRAIESKPDTGQNEGRDELVESMTDREKEIICCVARGMSNKEIADKLLLSINTVTTYRRNISAKLQIHSAAGLTIFAILHNLVDINEINPHI